MLGSSHYDLLGVSRQATREEIRRAYALRARDHHPDAHPDANPAKAEWARRQMVALNDAWKVLRDPTLRQAYDAELSRSVGAEGPPPATRPWIPGHVGNDARRPGASNGFRPFETTSFNEDTDEDFRFDGSHGESAPARFGDLILLAPVGILVLAAAMFAFGLMTESQLLWAFPLLLLPVAGVAFLGVQLLVMRRSATSATTRRARR